MISSRAALAVWGSLSIALATPLVAAPAEASDAVEAASSSASAVAAPIPAGPRLADERVVLATPFGDLVLALYPDVAPRHVAQVLDLVRLGAYDGTQVARFDPAYFIQISQVSAREAPLTAEQAAAERALPAEFSSQHHRLGTLSMARLEDPDSARSSFSILLAAAPHLDGEYTVFGYVESGGSVLRRIVEVPAEDGVPLYRIAIERARLVTDVDGYYTEHGHDPLLPLAAVRAAPPRSDELELRRALAPLLGGVALLGVAGFLAYTRLDRRHLLGLLLLETLIAGFGLLLLLVPVGHRVGWLAPLLFFGLYGLFRLMSRFESR